MLCNQWALLQDAPAMQPFIAESPAPQDPGKLLFSKFSSSKKTDEALRGPSQPTVFQSGQQEGAEFW